MANAKTKKANQQHRSQPTRSTHTVLAVALVVAVGIFVGGFSFWDQGLSRFLGLDQPIAEPQISVYGTYTASLPSTDTVGRLITLELKEDATAVFSQDYLNEADIFVESGTWQLQQLPDSQGKERITVRLKTHDKKSQETTEKTLIFQYHEAPITSLKLVEFDSTEWGEQGLTVYNTTPLIANRWTWVETVFANGSVSKTNAEHSFSLAFSPEARVSIATDCNSGMGSYSILEENQFSFGPIASTQMYCEGSQESTFFGQISEVESYFLENNQLRLNLKDNAGYMLFESETVQD